MSTKTITIMEDAYLKLKQNKIGQESFSDVIRRICKKTQMQHVFGTLKDMNPEDFSKFQESIHKLRSVERKI
ncbi:MAG: antitoxin VapB family protein [Candidatus Woesearchaeota archaeon]